MNLLRLDLNKFLNLALLIRPHGIIQILIVDEAKEIK